MSLDCLKLSKPLLDSLEENGFTAAKELQEKTLSRMIGGITMVAVGPQGCGKSTTLVLAVLMRLKYALEEAPRALILVSDKERGVALLDHFRLLGKNTNIRYLGIFNGTGLESQKEDLAEGTDIVVGTPDRIEFLYARSGLNLNKLKIFALDDASELIQKGFHATVINLAESLPKCQHLVFTEILHNKLERLITTFINPYTYVEVAEKEEFAVSTIDNILYLTPNYRTKLNLLTLILGDKEAFNKVTVFTNTLLTAGNLYRSLSKNYHGEVALIQALPIEDPSVSNVEEFLSQPALRVLIIANDQNITANFSQVPAILHFDVPLEKEVFLSRVETFNESESDGRLSIIFSTDQELLYIKKIEQMLGKAIAIEELPPNVLFHNDKNQHQDLSEVEDISKGGAFHQKKEANAKEYNYKYKDRLKMFGKKNRKGKKML